MNVLFFFLGAFIFTGSLNAQNEANIWYFGNKAGVDFNSGSPVALTNGQINTVEGCASIADASGNLLFYTDGIRIWDRTHSVMPNGTGLLGHSSSTQSATIIPKPGTTQVYYVFTVGLSGGTGLNYSEVDMSLNAGLGDVNTNKNILLAPVTSEKFTAIQHSNGIDFWIITKGYLNNDFYSFLVTTNGINSIATTTSIGAISTNTGGGVMKASPNGNLLGVCNRGADPEIFNFNKTTGLISLLVTLPSFGTALGPAHLEFSPNNQLFYHSEPNFTSSKVYQYDLTAGSPSNIINSKYQVILTPVLHFGMQLGPNGKIYLANFQQNFLSSIEAPNSVGAACNYQSNAVDLITGISQTGLPNYIPYVLVDLFSINDLCFGDSTQFMLSSSNFDSVLWYFDDPNSGLANASTSLNSKHVFSDTGTYSVSVVLYRNGQWVSLNELVQIGEQPNINLGVDTILCNNTSLVLDASSPNTSYLWQDNSTSPLFNINSSGNYSVTATIGDCYDIDSIDVFFIPCVFTVDSFCAENPTQFTYNYTQANSVQWNFDDLNSGVNNTSSLINPAHAFSTSGSFDVALTVYQNNSSFQINQNVQILASPIVDLGPDTSLCEDENITLDAGIANTYLWQDNTTLQNILVDRPDLYVVTVSNNNCSSIDSILIHYTNCIPCEVSVPNAFTPNQDGINDTFAPITTGNCQFHPYRFEIYNRWGQKIYATEEMNTAWDGTFQGIEQPQEVYLYVLYYNLDNGFQKQERQIKGQVTLFR